MAGDPVHSANLQFGAGFLLGLIWLRRGRCRVHYGMQAVPILFCITIGVVAASTLSAFPWRSIPTTIWVTMLAVPLVWHAAAIGRCDRWPSRRQCTGILVHLYIERQLLRFTLRLVKRSQATAQRC